MTASNFQPIVQATRCRVKRFCGTQTAKQILSRINQYFTTSCHQPLQTSNLCNTRIVSFHHRLTFPRSSYSSRWMNWSSCARKRAPTRRSFWARMAEELHWFKKWDTVLKWQPPHAEWFVGGKINISYNCLDRHLTTCAAQQGRADLGRRARRTTHAHLSATHAEVCKFANVLKSWASKKAIASRFTCR